MAMRIIVRVIPKASRNRIEQLSGNEYKMWVTVLPEKGKANQKVIELLSKHFEIPKTNITIIRGETSRTKTLLLSLSKSKRR